MNFLTTMGYIALWSVGYIAVHTVISSPMNSLESMIAGTKNQGA